MKMKHVALAGLLVCSTSVGMIAGAGRAQANHVTAPGVTCAYNVNGSSWSNPVSSVAPAYVLKVQANGGVSNPDSAPHDIFCPVVFSDTLKTGLANMYVDGNNDNLYQTSCTVYQYDYTGTLIGNIGFTSAAASYDQQLQPAYNSEFDYFVLKCPSFPGNNHATLRGISFEL